MFQIRIQAMRLTNLAYHITVYRMTHTCQKLNTNWASSQYASTDLNQARTSTMRGVISYGNIVPSNPLIFSRDNFDMYSTNLPLD